MFKMLKLINDYLNFNRGFLRDALLEPCKFCKDGRMRRKETHPSAVAWSSGYAVKVCDRCKRQKVINW